MLAVMRDSWLIRQNESTAALPWKSRLCRAATYAGIVWVVTVVGVIVGKYVFEVIDRPILTVIAQITILPLLLFGCFIFGYWKADMTKRSYDQKDGEHEKA
jgi:hypothetical protein